MTGEFVKKALTFLGVNENTWVTLDNKVSRINLLNNSTVSVHPLYFLFNFDANTEALYVCKLTGAVYQYTEGEIPDGFVASNMGGNPVLLQVSKDYIKSDAMPSGCRYFHTIISYDQIASFTNVSNDYKYYFEN